MTFVSSNHFKKLQEQHLEYVAEFGKDYNNIEQHFGLNKVEQAAVDKWAASLRAEIMSIQEKTMRGQGVDDIITADPYYGATGGGLTYSFIPTSLGTICVVKEMITGKELNVCEATDWFFYG